MRIKQALEKKNQEGKKEPHKRDNRFEAAKCIGGNRRGKETEQKRLSEESLLMPEPFIQL